MEEPWLRGMLPGLDPVIAHLLRASEQIREDSAKALAGLTTQQLWARPNAMTAAGFHAKHLAGSTNRLCAYLEGGEVLELADESSGDESTEALTRLIGEAFDRYDKLIRKLSPEQFSSIREVGRKRLPVTAISLAIHIAEHGQRHTGQLITISKCLMAHERFSAE